MIFLICGFRMGVCSDVGMIGLENDSVVFIDDGIQRVRSVISVNCRY